MSEEKAVYDLIMENVPDLQIFDPIRRSLRMKEHQAPVSVTEEEFLFLMSNMLASEKDDLFCYEMATGFGLSAMALAVRDGSHVVSIDSYIEEHHEHSGAYKGLNDKYEDSDGYKVAKKLAEFFQVEDYVDFYCGRSPEDVPSILEPYNRLIDFAFIDGAHHDENLVADMKAIVPYITNDTVIFAHDLHCFSLDALKECEDILHKKLNFTGLTHSYNLGFFK